VSVARDGAALVLGLPRGQYLTPRVAPDGRRVVVVSNTSLLETLHLERGSKARLSSSATGTGFPLWTQDGSGVVSRRFNRPYWVSADGSREGEVKGAQNNDFPSAAGPDPDSIIVSRVVPDNGGDAYLLSISGRFEPKPLVATKAYEGGAQLSRDGRWFVYCSDLSGQMQVYVRPYPALDRQWPISEGPGHQPRWSANGREIYFRDGESMMAVSFDGSKSEPLIGKPVALFKDDYDLGQGLTIANYDVTPDGRFIMLRREAQAGTLRIVLNWTEELKQILARGGAR
jgi:Tol biopolymer transport system component